MRLTGETHIAAPRERVWRALSDPAVLARAIEGCESLVAAGDDRFEGRVNAKIGPVRASFAGVVTLSDIDPPNGYTLAGEGKGGAAGFAKGGAEVALADDGAGGTRLSYTATASVGGKLAQLGGRLIEGAARGQADKFFAALKAELEAPAVDTGAAGEAAAAAPADIAIADTPPTGGLPMATWAAILVALALALLAGLLLGR